MATSDLAYLFPATCEPLAALMDDRLLVVGNTTGVNDAHAAELYELK